MQVSRHWKELNAKNNLTAGKIQLATLNRKKQTAIRALNILARAEATKETIRCQSNSAY